jgi:Bacterial PH domain
MIYRSKKAWLGALLIVAIALAGTIVGVVLIYASILDLTKSPLPVSGRVALAILGLGIIAICGILLWSYLSASYEITPEELVVRFGPIRPRYRLSSIAEAIPTRVPLRPGLNLVTSWDIVYIRFRGPSGRAAGWPLAISPANKTEFLRELADRVPGLSVLGEGTQEDSRRLEP